MKKAQEIVERAVYIYNMLKKFNLPATCCIQNIQILRQARLKDKTRAKQSEKLGTRDNFGTTPITKYNNLQ